MTRLTLHSLDAAISATTGGQNTRSNLRTHAPLNPSRSSRRCHIRTHYKLTPYMTITGARLAFHLINVNNMLGLNTCIFNVIERLVNIPDFKDRWAIPPCALSNNRVLLCAFRERNRPARPPAGPRFVIFV